MEYIGSYCGFQVFRNKGNFLEGYKSKGKRIQLDERTFAFSEHERIVTNQTTIEGFVSYVNGKKPKIKTIKAKDLPSLF